ncbi:MAG TPA: hypothetical protein DCM54_09075 [Gammaproteobacteria bacterium]|nr:hypothetical protein [Gammaproteobacteria bacterium]|tara:strand:+ start:493 stop:672 length:180 start_codon:yes stop_codon:yes gene_type:complete
MGLILFSIMLSIILGCCTWLVLGESFPLKEEEKWPVMNNIACYSALLALPIYLVIFFTF